MGVGLHDARKRQSRYSPGQEDDLFAPQCHAVPLTSTESRWPGFKMA